MSTWNIFESAMPSKIPTVRCQENTQETSGQEVSREEASGQEIPGQEGCQKASGQEGGAAPKKK